MSEEAIVRRLTPPQYIKEANARDGRIKHAIDLRHFVTFLRDKLDTHALYDLPDDELDAVVADYLDHLDEVSY